MSINRIVARLKETALTEDEKSKTVKTLTKDLGLPSGCEIHTYEDNAVTITWTKRGGYAGEKILDRVRKKAIDNGWKAKNADSANHPDGSWVANSDTYEKGMALITFRTHYGNTASDNRYSLTVRAEIKE